MKLRIQNTALIGDPDLGAELEIPTHGRVFDIEVVKESMSYQGMDFGVRPSLIKATTTSADDYKNWKSLVHLVLTLVWLEFGTQTRQTKQNGLKVTKSISQIAKKNSLMASLPYPGSVMVNITFMSNVKVTKLQIS